MNFKLNLFPNYLIFFMGFVREKAHLCKNYIKELVIFKNGFSCQSICAESALKRN